MPLVGAPVARGDGATRPGDGDDPWLPGDRHDVVSTNVDSQGIATVLYSRKGGVLQVRLSNGCAYCYRGVSRRTYDGLMKSKSKEQYLQRIKKRRGEIEIDRPGIKKIRIQNFRSIRDRTVGLGDLTVLIGANGTGKTSVLDALELFLSKGRGASEEDYHLGSDQIDITVDVNPGDHAVGKRFLRDGVIRLQKSFTKDGVTLRAETLCNVDFGSGREGMNPDALRQLAGQIREKYPGAPSYKSKSAYLADLADYEHRLSQDPKHGGKYSPGFVKYVPEQGGDANGGLLRMLSLIFVPAMKNIATEGTDGSRSSLSKLLEMTIHDERGERVRERVSKRIEKAYGAYRVAMGKRLRKLGKDLEEQSRLYMEGAEFKIDLAEPGEEASHLGAVVRMGDGGHLSLVDRAGSGLQRVYLLSLLDLIAGKGRKARKRNAGKAEGARARPFRLIVIDEPELYQHPQRQRQILKSLIRIAEDDPLVRIVCSTHSPYFVELRRADTLRLLRRGEETHFVTLDGLVGSMLGKDPASPGAREELSTWLDMNATHWITEGFFAIQVGLVEGHGDRNMLLATASAMADGACAHRGRGGRRDGGTAAASAGVDLDRQEVSIIPVDGVKSMPKFMRLFGEFKIPAYPIWDLDSKNSKGVEDTDKRNATLAGLASGTGQGGAPPKPDITPKYACFKDNLTMSLAGDLRDCADLLGGSEAYEGLQSARERDEDATRNRDEAAAQKRDRGRAEGRPAEDPEPRKGDVIDSQRRFLNSKLNVFQMLREIKEKDPGRLEKFATVQVVRTLDTLGKEARERAGRKGGRREALAAGEPGAPPQGPEEGT